jgi:hypothetical protein
MSLRREIDDVLRLLLLFKEFSAVIHEESARFQAPSVTHLLVLPKVFGKRLLELKRNALPHNPYTVHGIHQGLHVGQQHVARLVLNHWIEGREEGKQVRPSQ